MGSVDGCPTPLLGVQTGASLDRVTEGRLAAAALRVALLSLDVDRVASCVELLHGGNPAHYPGGPVPLGSFL